MIERRKHAVDGNLLHLLNAEKGAGGERVLKFFERVGSTTSQIRHIHIARSY